MSPPKEVAINVRCEEDFKAWVQRVAVELDMGASEFMRLAALVAAPQLRDIPALRDLKFEHVKRD